MGRKTVHFQKQSQAEFARQFTSLCGYKSSWEVWADFVTLSALTIANAMDREGETHDKREQEYLSIIKRYAKKEQQGFAELLARLVLALEEDPNQDFLGEMFMALELGSHWKGQFFTPYSICRLMAALTVGEREAQMKERGWSSINDPCCGAGALLIAARNEMVCKGLGPRQLLYVAQDIDRTAALMCYLQLSLLGCAGYVTVGDSLTQPSVSPTGSPLLISPAPGQEVWLMPALYDEVWVARIQFEKIKLLLTPNHKKGDDAT